MGNQSVEVYYKKGSYEGFDTDSSAWTKIADTSVDGKKQYFATPIPSSVIIPVDMNAGETYSFYVTLVGGPALRYSNGDYFSEDDNVLFIAGIGKDYPFGQSYAQQIWNGILRYAVC